MTSTPSPGSHPHTDLLRRLDKPGRREKIGHDMAELCKDAAAALRSQIAATDKAEREIDDLHADVTRLMRERREIALAVCARFMPGPDGQDYIDRAKVVDEIIAEAFDDGRDALDDYEHKMTEAVRRTLAAEADRDRLAARVETLEGAARLAERALRDQPMQAFRTAEAQRRRAAAIDALRALVAPDTPCDDCNGAGGWWEGQPGARIYVPCHACAPTDSSGHGA